MKSIAEIVSWIHGSSSIMANSSSIMSRSWSIMMGSSLEMARSLPLRFRRGNFFTGRPNLFCWTGGAAPMLKLGDLDDAEDMFGTGVLKGELVANGLN